MAAPVRFELTHVGVRVQCLTAWPWGKITYNFILAHFNNYNNNIIKKTLEIQEFDYLMVTGTGFGPVSACVKGMCVKPLHQPANNGGPGGT